MLSIELRKGQNSCQQNFADNNIVSQPFVSQLNSPDCRKVCTKSQSLRLRTEIYLFHLRHSLVSMFEFILKNNDFCSSYHSEYLTVLKRVV